MREEFHTDLQRLDAEVVLAGRDAQRAVEGTVRLLDAYSPDEAGVVIALDGEVRTRYATVEREIEVLLARQAPVAVDLRRVLVDLAVARHFERVAKNARRIAELCSPLSGLPGEEEVVDRLRTMGARAETMVEAAVDAFRDADVTAAEQLSGLVDLLDRGAEDMLDTVLDAARDPQLRAWALRMLIVARWFQRIGDHAVSVGERTIYAVTGERRELEGS